MSASSSRAATFAPAAARSASSALAAKPMSFPIVQRKCSCGAQTANGGTCDSCARKQGRTIQRKPNGGRATPTVPGIVYDVLRSPGSSLDRDTRHFFETRFNQDFSNVRVHTDAAAARSAADLGANAYTVGNHIAFGGSMYDPHGHAGRQLLAHELTHVVQQAGVSPGVLSGLAVEAESSAAEHEADARAAQVMSGAGPAPVAMTSPGAVQLDRAETITARKPEQKKEPGGVAVASMSVTLSGIYFEIPPEATYAEGPKAPQIYAAMLNRLLGPAYKPEIVPEVEAAVRNLNRKGVIRDQSRAKAGESMHVTVLLDVFAAAVVIRLLRSKKLPVQITPEQEKLLFLSAANVLLWDEFVGSLRRFGEPLPGWYTREIFDREMSQQGALLSTYAQTLQARRVDEAAFSTNIEAFNQIVSELSGPMNILEEIRKDVALGSDRESADGYAMLWDISDQIPKSKGPTEGKADASTAGNAPVIPPKITRQPRRLVSTSTAVMFLRYLRTQPELKQNAEAYHDARVKLLGRFGRYVQANLYTIPEKGGDEVIREQPGTANTPPFPATLTVVPDVGPMFEAALGTDHVFHMSVQFPSVYEALGSYTFMFERVPIPKEMLGKPVDVTKMRGDEPTAGEVAAVRFDRATAYNKADLSRTLKNIQTDLGPAGVGAATLAAANSILRYVGTGIRFALESLTMPRYEKRIVFPQAGLYLVRSAMSYMAQGGEAIVRPPSVAYVPVLARNPDEMAMKAVSGELKGRAQALQRITAIEAQLANPDLPKDERATLQSELDDLKLATASLGEQLAKRKEMLAKRLSDIEQGKEIVAAAEAEQLQNQLKLVEKQIERRAERKTEKGEALTARFVTDTGQSIPLRMEVVDEESGATQFNVMVSDITTAKSGTHSGHGKTRNAAIRNAVTELLEGTNGYGRGRVALSIGGGPIEVIRIEASMGSLLSEAVDNVALALTVAAVVAAPFTGGASLSILIPVGVVGAVPSAYRVAERIEGDAFELDLENIMEITNIAGSLIGLGRMGAMSSRMARVGRGLMIIGYGADALGGVLMGAKLLKDLDDIRKMPEGQRAAALLMLMGQTLVNAGAMAAHALSERGAQARTESDVKAGALLDPHAPPVEVKPGTPHTEPKVQPPRPEGVKHGELGAHPDAEPKIPKDEANKALKEPPHQAPEPTGNRAKDVENAIRVLEPMTDETRTMLRENPELALELAQNPDAARALRRCASWCWPKGTTAQQIRQAQRRLRQIRERYGAAAGDAAEYFLKNERENLESALKSLDILESMGETVGERDPGAGRSEAGLRRDDPVWRAQADRADEIRPQGRIAEEYLNEELNSRYTTVEREVQIVPNGPDGKPADFYFRADFVCSNAPGLFEMFESKATGVAPLTANQILGYAMVQRYGGTIRSRSKASLRQGDPIPAGTSTQRAVPVAAWDVMNNKPPAAGNRFTFTNL